MQIQTEAEFRQFAVGYWDRDGHQPPAAFGIGLATIKVVGEDVTVLDTRFAAVNCGENNGAAAAFAEATGYTSGTMATPVDVKALHELRSERFLPFLHDGKDHANIDAIIKVMGGTHDQLHGLTGYETHPVIVFIGNLDDPPVNAEDVYFRLHLLSHRKVQPHGVSLDGQFGLLSNNAWTNIGPILPDDGDEATWILRARGEHLSVTSVDKFPRMLDYVRPSGVRIADGERVRLGAHLAVGTTVMHEGFVNFNAGTLGNAMVEGRISAGVVVGADTDIGGGASIMGTLSGGGKEVITIGERCLLGANAGIGISLGDDCVVEAGLYVTSGTVVDFHGRTLKARTLSGESGLLFRRNSVTGAVQALNRKGDGAELRSELHAN